MKTLMPNIALEYLNQFPSLIGVENKLGGIDKWVLSNGYNSNGAVLLDQYKKAYLDSSEFEASLFIDGDVILDRYFYSSGLVFIKGQLQAPVVINSGMLVVLGDLNTSRFVGTEENGGTTIFGKTLVNEYLTAWLHIDNILGKIQINEKYTLESPSTSVNIDELFKKWQLSFKTKSDFHFDELTRTLIEWTLDKK